MRMGLVFAQACDLVFVVGKLVCCWEEKESVSECLEGA
jgi:hypothetical protein